MVFVHDAALLIIVTNIIHLIKRLSVLSKNNPQCVQRAVTIPFPFFNLEEPRCHNFMSSIRTTSSSSESSEGAASAFILLGLLIGESKINVMDIDHDALYFRPTSISCSIHGQEYCKVIG